MKIKVDKEMLLKHRFWVMLGATVFVILFGLTFLEFSVGAEDVASLNQKAIADAGKIMGPFESTASISERKRFATEANKIESDVWRNAYDAEKPLLMWPKAVEDKFQFAEGHFATDVNINPAMDVKNPKARPADNPFLMHGIFEEFDGTWFKIKNRDGNVIQFFTTETTKNVNVAGKAVEYQKLRETNVGKFTVVNYQRGRYFYDKLTPPQQAIFNDSYKSQIHEILEIVDPYDEYGGGVVQLRDWAYKPFPDFPADKSFILYVDSWNTRNDFSREAWIAQENIWIQRELYRIIREANDSIGLFKGDGGTEKNKPYKFENPYFELTLNLDSKDVLNFVVKNRLDRRQRIDVNFRVLMNKDIGFGSKAEVIEITAPPLAPRGDTKKEDTYTKTFTVQKDAPLRKGIFRVEQVLTWETAAVKRIDWVSIGSNSPEDMSHSHRTCDIPLTRVPVEDEQGDAQNQPKQRGQLGVKPGPGGKGVGFKPLLAGPVAVNGGPMENGLWRDRYIAVSPQSRRVPVGIVLIVDQLHVDRVMTSFDNSKLRFLPTQVLLNQYTGSMQPPAASEEKTPTTAPMIRPPGPPRPRINIGANPAPQPAAGSNSSLDTNMELVVYGIMTLYERYPPRPAALVPKKT